MGNVRFINNKILFNSNKIAMDADCCECEEDSCCDDGSGLMPKFLEVSFSSIDDQGVGTGCCPDCSCETWLNGNTFTLTSDGSCSWVWGPEECDASGPCSQKITVTAARSGADCVYSCQALSIRPGVDYNCFHEASKTVSGSPASCCDFPQTLTNQEAVGAPLHCSHGKNGTATLSIP